MDQWLLVCCLVACLGATQTLAQNVDIQSKSVREFFHTIAGCSQGYVTCEQNPCEQAVNDCYEIPTDVICVPNYCGGCFAEFWMGTYSMGCFNPSESCDNQYVPCEVNPCDLRIGCPLHPDAVCHESYCSECRANWFVEETPVDCFHETEDVPTAPPDNGYGDVMVTKLPTESTGISELNHIVQVLFQPGEEYFPELQAACEFEEIETTEQRASCPADPCQAAMDLCPGLELEGICVNNHCGSGCLAEFWNGTRQLECIDPTIGCYSLYMNCFSGYCPCTNATCEAHRDAICINNYCGGCRATWFVDGDPVDCNLPVSNVTIIDDPAGDVFPEYEDECEPPNNDSQCIDPCQTVVDQCRDAPLQGICINNNCGPHCLAEFWDGDSQTGCLNPDDCSEVLNMCVAAPCEDEICRAYPNATCVNNYCNGCRATWVLEGEFVDCTVETEVEIANDTADDYFPEIDSCEYTGFEWECEENPCQAVLDECLDVPLEGVCINNPCGDKCAAEFWDDGEQTACIDPVNDCASALHDCDPEPCDEATCPANPNAICVNNRCNGCRATWILDGEPVDCKIISQVEILNKTADEYFPEYKDTCNYTGPEWECDENPCQTVLDECLDVPVYGICINNPCGDKCVAEFWDGEEQTACIDPADDCAPAHQNCIIAPCEGATCPAHPNATCVNNYCNGCRATWLLDEEPVDCKVISHVVIVNESAGDYFPEYEDTCNYTGSEWECAENPCQAVLDECLDVPEHGICINNPCGDKCVAEFWDGEEQTACIDPADDCASAQHDCDPEPCDGLTCPAHPNATCVNNHCNGCRATWLLQDEPVDCKIISNVVVVNESAGDYFPEYDDTCDIPEDEWPCKQENPCQTVLDECWDVPREGICVNNPCGMDCVAEFWDGTTQTACIAPQDCSEAVFQCFVAPCQFAECPAHPNATCVNNYCQGCRDTWFLDGELVDCSLPPSQVVIANETADDYFPEIEDDCKYTGFEWKCEENPCQAVLDECLDVPMEGVCINNPCGDKCVAEFWNGDEQTACIDPADDCAPGYHNCITAPCDGAICPAHPNATCVNNYCNGCRATWLLDEEPVDCKVISHVVIVNESAGDYFPEYDDTCNYTGSEWECAENPCQAVLDECLDVPEQGVCINNPCGDKCVAEFWDGEEQTACIDPADDCASAHHNCLTAPCEGETCPAHPNATCVNNYCNGCRATWLLEDEPVDCKIISNVVIANESAGDYFPDYEDTCNFTEANWPCEEENPCQAVLDECLDVPEEGICVNNPCGLGSTCVAEFWDGTTQTACINPETCSSALNPCIVAPCDVGHCPAHPNATCVNNYCQGCRDTWFEDGELVDCSIPTEVIVMDDPVDDYFPEFKGECEQWAEPKVSCLTDPCNEALEICPGVPSEGICVNNLCGDCVAEFWDGMEQTACMDVENECRSANQDCSEIVCEVADCDAHPNATCIVNSCGGCRPTWFLDGRLVDCHEPTEDCDPGHVTCAEDPCLEALASDGGCPANPDAECSSGTCGVCRDEWTEDGEPVDCFDFQVDELEECMEGWVAFGLSCYRLFPVSWFLDIDEKFEIAQRECAVDGPGIINPGLVAIEYRVELEFLREWLCHDPEYTGVDLLTSAELSYSGGWQWEWHTTEETRAMHYDTWLTGFVVEPPANSVDAEGQVATLHYVDGQVGMHVLQDPDTEAQGFLCEYERGIPETTTPSLYIVRPVTEHAPVWENVSEFTAPESFTIPSVTVEEVASGRVRVETQPPVYTVPETTNATTPQWGGVWDILNVTQISESHILETTTIPETDNDEIGTVEEFPLPETTAVYEETTTEEHDVLPFVPLLPLVPEVAPICPEAWITYSGHCYRFHDTFANSQHDAQVVCDRQGAELVHFFFRFEEFYIIGRLDVDTAYPAYWTSGQGWGGDFYWVFANGSSVEFSYTNWMTGEPSEVANMGTALMFEPEDEAWAWGAVDETYPLPFICESLPETPPLSGCDSSPCLNGARCIETDDDEGPGFECDCEREHSGVICELDDDDLNDWHPFDGHSYQFFFIHGLTWPDAKEACASYNSSLVAFETQDELYYVTSQINGMMEEMDDEVYLQEWWTAGRRNITDGAEGDFYWDQQGVNDDPLCDLAPWRPGYPSIPPNEESRILLTYDSPAWTFVDVGPSEMHYFICERMYYHIPHDIVPEVRTHVKGGVKGARISP